MKPIVAIVGRPNVGKSALFNRIARERISIVERAPGVTRDRIYSDCEWLDRHFTLIDTGGIEFNTENTIVAETRRQAELAVSEADVVLFVVDGRDGLVGTDEAVAEVLRRSKKPVLLVVNKVDRPGDENAVYEFYEMGLGDPVAVSAEHGRNIGDLLDAAVEHFPGQAQEEEENEVIHIAVVGKPNVGKSSLVNKVLGQERVIVSDIPGTTRDAVDTRVVRNGTPFVLIDTAGLRKRKRVKEALEYYSVVRTLRAVDRSDVVFVMVDAVDGVTEQDKKIAGYAHEAGRAIILVVNKWDAIEKDTHTMKQYDEKVRAAVPFLGYAPILYISAMTGQRVNDLFEVAEYVANQHALRISTGRVNEAIQNAMALRQPPSDKGIRLKIFYAVQADVKPPQFILFVNRPSLMHFSYLRYLENQFREAFGFVGTPIVLTVKARS